MNNFEIAAIGYLPQNFTPKTFVFAGGEVSVKLPEECVEYFKNHKETSEVLINARIESSDDFMKLALLKDALEIILSKDTPTYLILGYIPHQQQDRVCAEGESLSSKVFANMINSLGFCKVVVADPHSDVSVALLDNAGVVHQHKIISEFPELHEQLKDGVFTLVSPDFGATKKTQKLAQEYGLTEIIQGVKVRNPKNGELSGFDVYGNVEGKDCLIVDDICVGGGTFLGLAEKLYEKGARSVELYITHGVFSNGIEHLLKPLDYDDVNDGKHLNHIYTTTTRSESIALENHPLVSVTNWCECE